MRIRINGDTREISSPTLEQALIEAGYEQSYFATAVNGEFVARSERARKLLSEGDRIEIVAPMQGG